MASSFRSNMFTEHLSPTTGAYGVLLSIILYYIFDWTDLFDFIIKLIWNALVFVTPRSLVTTLDSDFCTSQINDHDNHTSGTMYQSEKSNAMRRILRLDNGGIMHLVQRSRALSNVIQPRSTKLPGLGNWDNSCYQNSVLQGLASIQSLPKFLGSPSDTRIDTTRAALLSLASRLNDADNKGTTIWTPARLKNMSSWQQQDAQEYFSKVLDEVDKDTAQALAEEKRKHHHQGLSTPNVERQKRRGGPSGKEVALDSKRIPLRTDELPSELQSLILHNPLEGLLAQRVGCQRCGYVEGLSLVPFTCLTVSLGKDLYYDIRECLSEFTALESIEGVECAKCTLLQARTSMTEILKRIHAPSQLSPEEDLSQEISLARSIQERLDLVEAALAAEDFSETSLQKCQISNKSRVSSTKSKQAVIGRAPEALALHVNRSQFDEMTGMQTKNYAKVKFPLSFNLGPWYLGQGSEHQAVEEWDTDPSVSMLPPFEAEGQVHNRSLQYQLRAMVTHYGRHENGHYICYRQSPCEPKDSAEKADGSSWWQLSDQNVLEVTQEEMLDQSGVFMLFYERMEASDVGSSKPFASDTQAAEDIVGEDPEPSTRIPSSLSAMEPEDLQVDASAKLVSEDSLSSTTPPAFSSKESTPHLQQSVPQALPTPPPSPKLAATLESTKL